MAIRRLITLCFVLSSGHVNAQGPQELILGGVGGVDECHNTCTALVGALGESIIFYNTVPEGFKESYFCARQSEVIPACIIQPSSTQDVSTAIQIINQHSCHFAVKSGGHAMFAGGSNAAGGITIDLTNLNDVSLGEDKSTVSVGPGNRWGNVYKQLEPKGLTVVGGRVSSVGVGGFMLGGKLEIIIYPGAGPLTNFEVGGISFLSRFHGWASDNVRNYELIMANGSIANINYESHPDLFWALRGGGPNFGIVTRFDLETYRQGPVWGGNVFYTFSDMKEREARFKHLDLQPVPLLSLLSLTQTLGRLAGRLACVFGRCTTVGKFFEVMVNMATKGEADAPYMHLYMSFAYMPKIDLLAGSSCLVHTEPVANPPAFDEFKTLTPANDGTKITNLTDLMAEIDYWTTPGLRNVYSPMMFSANAELLSQILDFFIETIQPIKDIPGIFPSFVMQPMTQIARASRHKNGGSPFGIKEEDGPLIMLSISPQWSYAEDDARVQDAFARFMDRSVARAKELGLHHPFVYQNYANISQDVFGGYGEENRQRLRDIRAKYDPEMVFDKLQPGYFKL